MSINIPPRLWAVLPLFALALPLRAEILDEIIVTADFLGRSADELPVSITVFDATQIEERAVQHFEELINAVPNLNWSGDGHRARYFQIRGAGELEQYQGAPNPSVGFLIDDIDFSGIGTVATLFDMQQIEVLRGPQGTRYGANALAGLIYMQSTMPHAEPGGKAQLTVAGDSAYAAGVAMGGALSRNDSLLGRFSVHRHRSDGFRNNSYLGRRDTNGRDEATVRGRLQWLASDHWQVDVAAMYADIDNGYDAFALDNSYRVLSDKPGRDAQRSAGASLKLQYAGWAEVEFTAVTAAADSSIRFSFDADWGNADSWAPVTYDYVSVSDRSRSTISQEFRFTGNHWLAGIYGMRLRDDLATRDRGEYYDPFYDYADSLDAVFESDYSAINLALFGQYEFLLGDSTRLIAGLRAERRSTDYIDSSGLRTDPAESMLGGELSLHHDHADNLASFVTLSRGYKAGGFNLGPVPGDRREFGEEVMWSLEAGIKSGWADGRFAVDASVFYARRDDQQVRTSFQVDAGDPTTFIFFTDNAASGVTRGLEAALRWQASDAWEFYLTAGLLDATFDTFVTPQVNLNGRQQAHAPESTLAAGARYAHPSGFFARLDLSSRSDFYFDVSHDQKSAGYALANARIGYETGRWSVQLWARNLFDEAYAVRGFYFGNEPPDFPAALYKRLGDRRQLGLTADFRF